MGTLVLTRAMIHAGKVSPAGWNKRQVLALGITWSDRTRHGWIDRAVGKVVTEEAYRRFLALKGEAGRKKPRRPPRGDARRAAARSTPPTPPGCLSEPSAPMGAPF